MEVPSLEEGEDLNRHARHIRYRLEAIQTDRPLSWAEEAEARWITGI